MATHTAQHIADHADSFAGTVLRPTVNPPAGTWYELASRDGEHHAQRLSRKQHNGREAYLIDRFEKGWLAFYRSRRWRTSDGEKRTTRELVAVPPDYRFRTRKTKPGWS